MNPVEGVSAAWNTGMITFIFFAKAHSAFASTFRHANVIHDEKIDFQIICATATNFPLRCNSQGECSSRAPKTNFFSNIIILFCVWLGIKNPDCSAYFANRLSRRFISSMEFIPEELGGLPKGS